MLKVVQFIAIFFLMQISLASTAFAVDYAKIYKKQCATCHGNKGNGKGRAGASFKTSPTDFTAPQNQHRFTLSRLKISIKNGVAGTSMVGYGRRFNDETLTGLALYLQHAFMTVLKKHVSVGNHGRTIANNLNTEQVSKGKAIYVKHCSACHGDKGESAVWAKNGLNPPPRNFTTQQASNELSFERMISSVTYGRPGTAMMPFEKRLQAREIETVVDYIRNNFMRNSAPASILTTNTAHNIVSQPQPKDSNHMMADMTLSFNNRLIGDYEKGKNFYSKNCFTCHGKKGDGKGPRSHFNYPKPRNFTSRESRSLFNRPRLFRSISHGKRGSVMPAWSKVLNSQQIANVAEYVLQEFILNKSQVFLHVPSQTQSTNLQSRSISPDQSQKKNRQ